MKLSTVILARNEEKTIEKAVRSVEFSNEIIVIDDFSEDRTVEIALQLGCIVFQRKLNKDFSRQRNFGLSKSRGDWVFFLDADEELTEDLQQEVKNIIKENTQKSAYYIKRRDYMWGREVTHGELQKVSTKGIIRLVKKNSGRWSGYVHEEFRTDFPTSRLNSYIRHFPHQTLKEFIEEINFYSSIRARELLKQGKTFSLFQLLFFPLGKFITNYFLKLGFIDGPPGFLYAFMMSFHSFLVRAKLFQYSKLE